MLGNVEQYKQPGMDNRHEPHNRRSEDSWVVKYGLPILTVLFTSGAFGLMLTTHIENRESQSANEQRFSNYEERHLNIMSVLKGLQEFKDEGKRITPKSLKENIDDRVRPIVDAVDRLTRASEDERRKQDYRDRAMSDMQRDFGVMSEQIKQLTK